MSLPIQGSHACKPIRFLAINLNIVSTLIERRNGDTNINENSRWMIGYNC